MSVLSQFLFLDPAKHPYIVVSGKGNPVARFSNVRCAALSITLKKQKNPGVVVTPDGDTLDKEKCHTIVDTHKTVDRFVRKEQTALEVMYGSR
jgi:hypothetical protein